MVRAKFNVMSITKFGNGGGWEVKLAPVMGNSDENKKFWKYTPSGNITMHIDNEEAAKAFDTGEYYVDFTRAE